MPVTYLYESDIHRNILLEDFGRGLTVQANQHLIVHKNEAMLLDPGGHKAYPKTRAQAISVLKDADLRYLFMSHQDPDTVAATNGWLMTTDADAYISQLWTRFVPHYGIDELVAERITGIPDEGTILDLAGIDLVIIPAHFLHACGNFQVYDPVSKILYTGDMGASLGMEYDEVKDFNDHLQYMEGFHKRYMISNKCLQAYTKMIRQLDIETVAPQHGAYFKGRELVNQFFDWLEGLECGIDIMTDIYKLPSKQ